MSRDQKKAQKLLKEANRFSFQNRNGKASKRYEQALALDPRNLDLIEAYADHARKCKNYSRSAELWDTVIEIDPENYLAYKESGNSYSCILGKHEKALERFNSAINLKSDDEELFCLRGDTLYFSGFYKEAIADWDRIQNLNHSSRCYRIHALVQLQKHDEAMKETLDLIEFYKTFADAQPDGGFNYYSIANALHLMKENSIALEVIDQYISLNPMKFSGYRFKATILESLGKQSEAVLEYGKAINADCNNKDLCELYYNRGCILFELERFKEAFDDFEKTLELGQDDEDVHCFFAESCVEMGKFECGLRHIDIYIRSMPGRNDGHWVRAKILLFMHKIEESRSEYAKAWSMTPAPKRQCFQCQLECESQKLLKTCGNCRGPSYCSKECQKLNWAVHKKDCKQWQAFIKQTETRCVDG